MNKPSSHAVTALISHRGQHLVSTDRNSATLSKDVGNGCNVEKPLRPGFFARSGFEFVGWSTVQSNQIHELNVIALLSPRIVFGVNFPNARYRK